VWKPDLLTCDHAARRRPSNVPTCRAWPRTRFAYQQFRISIEHLTGFSNWRSARRAENGRVHRTPP